MRSFRYCSVSNTSCTKNSVCDTFRLAVPETGAGARKKMFAAVAWDKLNIPPVDEFSKDPTVPYRPKINMATVCKGRVHPDDVVESAIAPAVAF